MGVMGGDGEGGCAAKGANGRGALREAARAFPVREGPWGTGLGGEARPGPSGLGSRHLLVVLYHRSRQNASIHFQFGLCYRTGRVLVLVW